MDKRLERPSLQDVLIVSVAAAALEFEVCTEINGASRISNPWTRLNIEVSKEYLFPRLCAETCSMLCPWVQFNSKEHPLDSLFRAKLSGVLLACDACLRWHFKNGPLPPPWAWRGAPSALSSHQA
jgi:hypothetical protein